MSIWLDENSKVVYQGLTGSQGRFYGLRNRDYGTNVVAGTNPKKAGEDVDGIPVFATVGDAVAETGADVSCLFIPAPFIKDGVMEAAEGGVKLDEILGQWMDQAAEQLKLAPAETMPKAIMVPHVDYPRGWINYASGWGRLRGLDAPDRIVILGTNHFGSATGVCGCDKGYETPLGVSPLAQDFFDAITAELGPENTAKLLEHRYDHERAHAIELQVAWLQHVFGGESNVPVMGFVVHDPLANAGESYDGEGLGIEPFVEALRGAIGKLDGETLIVAAADLAHVGPQFGDQQTLVGDDESAKAFREEVMNHDRQMVGLIAQGKHSELVSAIQWQQNRMRWTGLGPIVAAMRACGEPETRVLNYFAAADPKGQALVSSFAAAIG